MNAPATAARQIAGKFSADDERLLRALYPDNTAAFCAQVLGRKITSVYMKAAALGLVKSPAFYASDRSGRVQRGRQHPRMVSTQFKPGLVPWNTGMRGLSSEGSKATQFKPGRPAHEARNYLPIGSLRVTRDGYLERKVTDDPARFPARRWTAVHRLVWESAHGPVPRGHVVTFKPGMKSIAESEITVDRLECISRAEQARRNHPRSKSPELGKLVQLKGQITRQVNRINREARESAGENP